MSGEEEDKPLDITLDFVIDLNEVEEEDELEIDETIGEFIQEIGW